MSAGGSVSAPNLLEDCGTKMVGPYILGKTLGKGQTGILTTLLYYLYIYYSLLKYCNSVVLYRVYPFNPFPQGLRTLLELEFSTCGLLTKLDHRVVTKIFLSHIKRIYYHRQIVFKLLKSGHGSLI